MIKKVIYISWMPLTDYVCRTWFIDYLIQRNMAVEFWDVASMLRGDIKEFGEMQAPYVRQFGSYDEIEAAIIDAGAIGIAYISLISLDGASCLRLFHLLSKYECKTVFVNWGNMPIKSTSDTGLRRIMNKLADPIRIVRTAFSLCRKGFYIKFGLIRKYSLCFVAGEQLMHEDQFAEKTIPLNMSDYDTYRNISNTSARVTGEQYVVFLDINLPFQSDLALGRVPALNANEYYTALSRFFDLIERTYSTRVIIAAHHKSDNTYDRFRGREFYHGKTAELVKYADFIISHHSTSVGYAILNNKPIIFVYTNEMQKLYANCRINWIKDLAEYFGLPTYNIDKVIDGQQVRIEAPSEDRYQAYKYGYLTSHETENSTSAEIFWREINAV
jgi:hypothetical protein